MVITTVLHETLHSNFIDHPPRGFTPPSIRSAGHSFKMLFSSRIILVVFLLLTGINITEGAFPSGSSPVSIALSSTEMQSDDEDCSG